MNVKDLYGKVEPEKVLGQYVVMHTALFDGMPVQQRTMALHRLYDAIQENVGLVKRKGP